VTGDLDFFNHPAIRVVDNVDPYFLRKVRILNGLHTAMAAKYQPAGFETVLQVMQDKAASRWLRGLLFEEIVPAIAHRAEGVAEFADQVWDRLRNPFVSHKLTDILKQHAEKVRIRLKTTHDEYTCLFGKVPPRLSEVLALPPDTGSP
jgi:tagaturonate reductase